MTYMAQGMDGGDDNDNINQSSQEDGGEAGTAVEEGKAQPRVWLENMRRDRHMSQRELAKKMGCSQQTLQRFERDGVPMLDKWYFKLAEIFKVPIAQLLSLDGLHTLRVGAVLVNGGELVPQADHPRVVRPPADMERNRTRAAMVDDDSMEPRFYLGDIVFYDSVVESFKDAFYRDCIVRLEDGEVLMRRVMPGRTPRVVTIEGYSPHVETLENIEPSWIAPVRWTRHG